MEISPWIPSMLFLRSDTISQFLLYTNVRIDTRHTEKWGFFLKSLPELVITSYSNGSMGRGKICDKQCRVVHTLHFALHNCLSGRPQSPKQLLGGAGCAFRWNALKEPPQFGGIVLHQSIAEVYRIYYSVKRIPCGICSTGSPFPKAMPTSVFIYCFHAFIRHIAVQLSHHLEGSVHR